MWQTLVPHLFSFDPEDIGRVDFEASSTNHRTRYCFLRPLSIDVLVVDNSSWFGYQRLRRSLILELGLIGNCIPACEQAGDIFIWQRSGGFSFDWNHLEITYPPTERLRYFLMTEAAPFSRFQTQLTRRGGT